MSGSAGSESVFTARTLATRSNPALTGQGWRVLQPSHGVQAARLDRARRRRRPDDSARTEAGARAARLPPAARERDRLDRRADRRAVGLGAAAGGEGGAAELRRPAAQG